MNFRRTPPVLPPAEDANDAVNPFGNDTLSGFNISTIAIEVPVSTVTSDANDVIGAYASTSRQKVRLNSRLATAINIVFGTSVPTTNRTDLPTPHDGRNRRHIDCGEPSANPCN